VRVEERKLRVNLVCELHSSDAMAAKLKPERVLSALVSCLQIVCQQLVALQGVVDATHVHVAKLLRKHIDTYV